jgi:hypothetical protein
MSNLAALRADPLTWQGILQTEINNRYAYALSATVAK